MNIVVISPGADTGGQGYRIKQSFERYGANDFKVRAVHAKDNYIKYPSDVFMTKKIVQELYDWADVVHFKNRLDLYPIYDRGQKKPVVIHHQGTRLRDNAKACQIEDRSVGAVPLVSTVDLLEVYPEAVWLPAPADIDFLAGYRIKRSREEVRICQAPTARKIKSTDLLISTVNELSKRRPILLDIVEGLPWKVALSRKGRCDIFVDQLILGYGNNAIEAWAMGLPVVAGVRSPWVREKMIEVWGQLPFYEANESNLEEKLEDLIKSPELREEYGARGLAHVQRFHSDLKVFEFLKDLYPKVPRSLGPAGVKLAGVR